MSTFKFKIERGLVVPPLTRSGRDSIYPTSKMEVGDSFLIPKEHLTRSKSAGTSYYAKKGWKFKKRMLPDGLRVWRIQ